MKNHHLKKSLAVGVICLLMLVSFSIAQGTTDHFEDNVVVISGKCNTVEHTGLWPFGFKLFYDRDVTIQTKNEDGERINCLIHNGIPAFAFYGFKNSIKIELKHATGLFFWGGKSLLFNNTPPRILVRCRAQDICLIFTANILGF
jgi:hypothetical protein